MCIRAIDRYNHREAIIRTLIYSIIFFLAIVDVNATDTGSALDFDLSQSKTNALGRLVKDKTGKFLIRIEVCWTTCPKRIDLPHKNFLNGKSKQVNKIGELFLITSPYKTEASGKLKLDNLKFIPFFDARDLIEELASASNFSGEMNPSWQICESQEDCIKATNKCNYMVALNKLFLKNYLQLQKNKKVVNECIHTGRPQKEQDESAACANNYCSVITILRKKSN